MLTFYFRSSSINDYLTCPLKYYIGYILNYKFDPHVSAKKGTVVHKAMELLGLWKLAIQNNQNDFYEEEIDKTYLVKDFNTELAIHEALIYYVNVAKLITFNEIDDCLTWYNKVITDYKSHTPLGNKVKKVEHHFDFEIDKPWAEYNFTVGNKEYKGKLALKGTVDLMLDHDEHGIEVVDYKTSSTNKCWITNKVKNSESMLNDFQFQLYFYALCHEFPEIESFLMTLLLIRAGGPVPTFFTKKDLPRIEERIKNLFEEIKNNKKPSNIKYDKYKNFKCGFCPFSKNNYKDTGVSLCNHFEKEIKEIGLANVDAEHFDDSTMFNYSGGGRTSR